MGLGPVGGTDYDDLQSGGDVCRGAARRVPARDDFEQNLARRRDGPARSRIAAAERPPHWPVAADAPPPAMASSPVPSMP